MTNLLRPSFKSGYARKASESANPHLWSGLDHLWLPVLGNTGRALRDVVSDDHGSFVNQPAWQIADRELAIKFDEVDDHILATSPQSPLLPDSNWTIHFRLKIPDNTGIGFQYFFSSGAFNATPSVNIYFAEASEGTIPNKVNAQIRGASGGGAYTTTATVGTRTDWMDLTIQRVGLSIVWSVDGEFDSSSSITGMTAVNPGNLYFGSRSDLNTSRFYGGWIGGVGIWHSAPPVREIVKAGLRGIVERRRRVLASVPAAGGGGATAVGVASETDSALSLASISKAVNLDLPAETDSALGVTISKRVTLGIAVETDSAIAVAHSKRVVLGVAGETDTALGVTVNAGTQLGIAQEADTALPLASISKRVNLGLASETNSGLSVTPAKRVSVGIASEVDVSFPLTHFKRVILGVATSIESALGVTVSGGEEIISSEVFLSRENVPHRLFRSNPNKQNRLFSSEKNKRHRLFE